jgi:SM-20-related protein
MTAEPLREVIDGLAPEELFAQACQLGAATGWAFGHGSKDHDTGRFWKMELDGIGVFDAIWSEARERCEQLAGLPLKVMRQYANGHTYGLGGGGHVDDVRPGSYTLLYYPMAEWREEWEGETLFYGEDGEVALAVRPRPNRAVLFDSRIRHVGRAPGRAFPGLRVTVAFKLEAVVAEAPVIIEEGLETELNVVFAAERVRAMVEAHLTKLGQTVRLPRFRPGKIPMAVLEKRYGDAARAEAQRALAAEVAASHTPEGGYVATIQASEASGGLGFVVTVVRPGALADPDLSAVTLVRLSGIPTETAREHLKEQLLDYLNGSYSFTLPGGAVEREFQGIWRAAQAQGLSGEDAAVELRAIAERRVRTGIVIAELARRRQISGPAMEDRVADLLIAQSNVVDREATPEELAELG